MSHRDIFHIYTGAVECILSDDAVLLRRFGCYALHRPWMMVMQWHELLCMHGPVPPAAMRSLIPPALALETFDGMAWLSITPFRMADPLQLRLLPHASLPLRAATYCGGVDAGNRGRSALRCVTSQDERDSSGKLIPYWRQGRVPQHRVHGTDQQ
jgi:hypothetical protein